MKCARSDGAVRAEISEREAPVARLVASAFLRTIRTNSLAEVYAHPRQETRPLERRGLLHRLAHGFLLHGATGPRSRVGATDDRGGPRIAPALNGDSDPATQPHTD